MDILYNKFRTIRVEQNIVPQYFCGGVQNQEKYSRGWRGAPAKGVGRETGARVQIPLSPFDIIRKLLEKFPVVFVYLM